MHNHAFNRLGRAALIWHSACLVLLLLSSCIDISPSGVLSPSRSSGRFALENLALSPDGHMVAFQFHDRKSNERGLGLLDRRNGQITRIANPPGRTLVDPSFSHDGTRLAVSESHAQIGILDLATQEIRWVSERKGENGASSPAFQPGTENIIYVSGDYPKWHGLNLIKISDHSEITMADEIDGFYGLWGISFASNDEIFFVGMGPKNNSLAESVKSLSIEQTSGGALYKIKFGERPELTFNDITLHDTHVGQKFGHGVLNVLSADGGKIIIFIGLSETNPNLKAQYNYEIFKREDGRIVQLTDIRSHLARLAVSYDGSIVAFGSDPTRSNTHDLFILDVKTGAIMPTGLLQHLNGHPEFQTITDTASLSRS